MHMSSFCLRRVSLFSCLLLAPVLSSPSFAAEPTAAIKMPKAYKSLLLDIEQVGSKVVMVGERGHILLSQDQGQSWVQADVPTAQMLTSVSFPSEKMGWAVGHDGNIVHTQDGGETWVLQRDGLVAQGETNISAASAARALVKDLEAKIEAASMSGEGDALVEAVPDENGEVPLTLEEQLEEAQYQLQDAEDKLTGPVIAPPLMDVWFADEQNGWASGAFGKLLQTTDGGKTWIDRGSDINNPDGYHLNTIIGHQGTLYVAGEAGFLVYSKDNGQTWTQADIGYDGTIFGLFAASNGSFVIATGLRGNTFRSIDGGVSWQALDPDVDYSLTDGVVYASNHVVMVGAGGAVTVSLDGGDTFKHYTLPARASLSGVIALGDGQFMLVGQGGVYRFDINAVAE